jgi:carbon monoxide dehydrogenase subunit G
MPSFRNTIDIAADPERVWGVLGDVTSVVHWVPGVTAVTRTETGRSCTFADGRVQEERILDYSPGTRSYRYAIAGIPVPGCDSTGRFAVEAAGAGARVVWESRLEPADPATADEVAGLWEPFLPVILANLKALVEDRPASP